jgi:hypothetical protein
MVMGSATTGARCKVGKHAAAQVIPKACRTGQQMVMGRARAAAEGRKSKSEAEKVSGTWLQDKKQQQG